VEIDMLEATVPGSKGISVPHRSRRLTAGTLTVFGLLLGLAGCVSRQSLAVNTASEAWSCPQGQIVAADLGEHQFRATGCGKEETFFCDYVTENEYTAKQHTYLTCRSLKPAVQAPPSVEDTGPCGTVCNSGRKACKDGCRDSVCLRMCDTMAQGCVEGCLSSQRAPGRP
jgi:hypothetical protein